MIVDEEVVQVGLQRFWWIVDSSIYDKGELSHQLPLAQETKCYKDDHIFLGRIIGEIQFFCKSGDTPGENDRRVFRFVGQNRTFTISTFAESREKELPERRGGKEVRNHLIDTQCCRVEGIAGRCLLRRHVNIERTRHRYVTFFLDSLFSVFAIQDPAFQ